MVTVSVWSKKALGNRKTCYCDVNGVAALALLRPSPIHSTVLWIDILKHAAIIAWLGPLGRRLFPQCPATGVFRRFTAQRDVFIAKELRLVRLDAQGGCCWFKQEMKKLILLHCEMTLLTELYEPLGPITFGKSRRTTQLNHCISIQDIRALNCTLAGSAGTLYRLHGILMDRKLSYCCLKPLSSFDRNQSLWYVQTVLTVSVVCRNVTCQHFILLKA